MTFHSILEAVACHAKNHPDHICIIDKETKLSYAEFLNLSCRYAQALKEAGVCSGDRVLVEAQQRGSFLAIEMGLHQLGAVFVPLEKNTTAEKMLSVANACGACLLVSIAKKPEGLRALDYGELLSLCPENASWDFPMPAADTFSELLFTTGTTGKEKGIVLTHGNDVAVAENIMYGVGMGDDNVEIIPSPLNHSHGLRSCYANLLRGTTLILLDSMMDMKRFFQALDEFGANSIDMVPSAVMVMLKLSGKKIGDYDGKLRYIEFGSAPLNEEDKQQLMSLLPHVALYNFYGSTESGRSTVYNFNTPSPKKGCIGKPTHNTRIVMVDDDHCPVESGKDCHGLLASYGPMNMREYWQSPEETRLAVLDRGIFSQDEGYYDEDGDIILVGRKGDVINIGGKKVAPDEIESIVRKLPGVEDCGCVGIPDPMKGAVPKLVVQMKRGTPFDPKIIKEALAKELDFFKMPQVIVETDKIPRSFNGKLLRRKL